MELVRRRVPGLDRGTPGQTQRAHGFDWAVGGLRRDEVLPGESCSGGRFGIHRVGLAAPAAQLPVRPTHLVHLHPSGSELPEQAKPVGAATLDTDGDHIAELGQPRSQRDVTV